MEAVNHEYYVSFEVAKLLKEAGFDWEVQSYYSKLSKKQGRLLWLQCGCNYKENINTNQNRYSTPTLDEAQRWLREMKNLVLLIDITSSYCNGKPMGYKFVIHISCGKHIYGDWKDTYEVAQEAGIKKALEIILEKVK